MARHHHGVLFAALAGLFTVAAGDALAQSPLSQTAVLKRMSLDELANLEVTLVSKRPEKLTETASAVQVITADDIRRSGATSLPEALRLATNLRVAQVNAYGWVVSARGFSGVFTNKLLVMIDGRSVYTPLFAGVLWDVQNPLLEDIDRIEIVSGPGGTLWGTNAVNGVINIVTKRARDSQGLYVSAGGGSTPRSTASLRYGGAAGPNLSWRAYGERSDRAPSRLPSGADATDAWNMAQLGGRIDWQLSPSSTITIQGDAYAGTEETLPEDSSVNGQNILVRWSHARSSSSGLTLQAYVDRTYRRDVPSTITDKLVTMDVDFQQHFAVGGRHDVLWGAVYRRMADDTPTSTAFVGFVPQQRDMTLASAFVQDEVTLIPARLKVTAGTKIEHNTFSGIEWQPSGRLAWTASAHHTIWGAISRAVRSPSRIDVDYHIPARVLTVGEPGVNGGPTFDAETMIAYEVGVRTQVTPASALSIATFFNAYDDLFSVEPVNGTATYQIQNGTQGTAWGVEITETYQPNARWRLRGGYTYFRKDLSAKPGHVFDPSSLGNDPGHQALLQSTLNIGTRVEFDLVARAVSSLPKPSVAGYVTADVRVAWKIGRGELAVVGQNVTAHRHAEFDLQQIPRSVHARTTWRF